MRVDIHPADSLIHCKNTLGEIFGAQHNRHPDPEKQKTLAAVIAVVDYEKLSPSARSALDSVIIDLEKTLKSIKNIIPLLCIEWIEYRKRTLSDNSRLSVCTFKRSPASGYQLKLFDQISEKHELPSGLSQSTFDEGIRGLEEFTNSAQLSTLKL